MSEKLWFTRKEFARLTGFSRARLSQLIKAGKIRPENLDMRGKGNSKRRIKMTAALQDIADSLMIQNRAGNMEHVKLPPPNKTKGVKPPPEKGDKTARVSSGTAVVECGFSSLTLAGAQEETARQKAAELKMKNDTAMGKLIDADEAKKQAFDCARLTRDAILSVPDRMAAELASITDVHEINDRLTRELIQALEDLAEMLI